MLRYCTLWVTVQLYLLQRTFINIMAQSANSADTPASTHTDYAIERSFSYDNPYAPSTYHGSSTEDADDYIAYIERYATYRHLSEQQRLELLPVLLRDSAIDWYETLSHDEVSSWPNFKKSFLDRFGRTAATRFRDMTTLWSTSQATDETVDNYYSRMVNLARRLPHLDNVIIRDAVIRGLRPSIRAKVLSAEVQTMKQLLDTARLSEMAISSEDDMMSSLLHELRTTKEQHSDEIRQLSIRLDKLSMTALDHHHRDETSPSLRRHVQSDGHPGRSPSPPPRSSTHYEQRARPPTYRRHENLIRRQPSSFYTTSFKNRGTIHEQQSRSARNDFYNKYCKKT